MQTIKLGKVLTLFPDGVSQTAYRRVSALIREHGPLARVNVIPGDHESLNKALDELKRSKRNASRRARDEGLRSLGLTKVRVNGEILWE
jgi:hypothetical protein